MAPIARAIALTLAAGAVTMPAHAQRAFSPAWFANKGAIQNTASQTGLLPNGMPAASLTSPLGQQQKANEQLTRSLNNLNLAARGIAAQQAAQAAARLAAANDASVPDGLGEGGLKVDTNSLTAGWINANGPVQTLADGRANVAIQQTADKAILNWESFNVGKNTTVDFKQQADWAVLNRVNDPLARPSQIQGQIKADGTVLIANRNGVIFSGTSQVDTRNLAAAAAHISDSQFNTSGIYSAGTTAAFTDAQGKVEVQAGAKIATLAPKASTEGGGYVLLLGQEVHNAGDIATHKGQTAFAAGDSFVIRKGVGTDGNQTSTTRGNEITPQFNTDSLAGKASNTGLILAREGDVTMVGRDVQQNGVALATTTVNTRGTVHLNAVGADGKIALGLGATTAVVIEDDGQTALDSQRDGLRGPAVASTENIVPVNDRRDQSRIEITSSGTVDFQGDSLTLATGGQIIVNAAQRSLVRDGAQLDVSGAVGVNLAMESNNIKVNVQGNEQRDAPVNRDDQALNSNDVWIDRRTLVFVPKGTNGYDSDRWYTAGGLLEVGGYLGTQGHTAGEWMAQGGTVSFGGQDVVTQAGSHINLSGGTINVQTGFLNQTWLKGADGRLYEVSKAPGDQLYTGLYKGFEDVHARWDQTDYFYNPLIAPQKRLENGYTVGRDAGKLVIATNAAVLEGEIISEAFQGSRQTEVAQADLDGYNQSHNAAARRGQLIVGQYLPMYDKSTGVLNHVLSAVMDGVELKDTSERIAAGLDLATALPAERQGALVLDTTQLNGFELGEIRIAARETIAVDSALQVTSGGNITLFGTDVAVNADITAHSGSIHVGNSLTQITANGVVAGVVDGLSPIGTVQVAQGATLDASGLWSNLLLDPANTHALPYRNGGSVSLQATGDVTLEQGSLIEVSSGAALHADGRTQGGRGGSVVLAALPSLNANDPMGSLVLDGELRAYGVQGGGSLTLQANKVLIGDAADPQTPEVGTLLLDGGFFDKGFSDYEVIGKRGVTVSEGTQVNVSMPVLRLGEQARSLVTGSDPRAALEVWTPPLYSEDPIKGQLTQRSGASLALQAGTIQSTAGDMASVTAEVGQGAVINVDPGQSIALRSIGQLTVNGTLNAWGGEIVLGAVAVPAASEIVEGAGHGRSIWIGEQAVLDVAGRAVSATDARGQRYGEVNSGGSIVIGGEFDHATGETSTSNLFVVVREGALLDASGTSAALDIPGQGVTTIASHGGSISLASSNGLYLDGTLRATAGGAGAAGGSLTVALDTPFYRTTNAGERVRQVRELVLGQQQGESDLAAGIEAAEAADQLTYGHARVGADQIEVGGFDNLTLASDGLLSFDGDVSLSLGQSLNLYTRVLGLTDAASDTSQVELAAPYVRLAGYGGSTSRDNYIHPTVQGGRTGGISSQALAGSLQVRASQMLEIRDILNVGVRGGTAGSEGLPALVDRRGFDEVELASGGDLRFLAATLATGATEFYTGGDLTLAAAQVYPGTDARAEVYVGWRGPNTDFDPLRTLTLARSTDSIPAMPYSAFGNLTLGAATINQGGVLRAPLGILALGAERAGSYRTESIQLLPGSLTSVSGAGLVMPYGGTVDGQVWTHNGQESPLWGVASLQGGGITLLGKTVQVQDGAVLDLSGGGELTGAGFVSGRGGSTDARFNPLVQIGPDGFTLPGLASNPVYAIVPGAQPVAAPSGGEAGAVDPMLGQQVTIGGGVPGLPAGTYTLMPSTYALLPGAYRVEVNGLAGQGAATPAMAMRNGSWSASGALSIAGTGIRDSLSRQLILTPADVLRSYSQYNEMSYADFVRAEAARAGVPRAMIEADARTLRLRLADDGEEAVQFSFEGIGRFDAAEGGYGGTLSLTVGSNDRLEILATGTGPTQGFEGVSVYADDLNAVGAKRLMVGDISIVNQDNFGSAQGANIVNLRSGARDLVLRSGAQLEAPEVVLGIHDGTQYARTGSLIIEDGASINTLGRGQAPFDSTDGYFYSASTGVIVSNGQLTLLAPEADANPAYSSSIQIGGCAQAICTGTASLYSEGTIGFATNGAFELADSVRYGTRHLSLTTGGFNIGSAQALAAATARGALTPGLALNQDVMQRLLQGDTSTGAPALESLSLTARDSMNFYESVTLSTLDAQGVSLLDKLLLTTPAIYGYGAANDVALIQTGNLIWNGSAGRPAAVATDGAGTGSGTLAIEAERIEFGYGPSTQPSGVDDLARLALGFANVNLSASERITANNKGSLAVYQSQGAYVPGEGNSYSGGNLNIVTPLMTSAAGSVNHMTAGGAVTVSAPAGSTAAAVDSDALGAELSITGQSLLLDTAVVLPSGKLVLTAENALTLADGAQIDMAGRSIAFFEDEDATQYSWGGDVTLQSDSGDIRQAAGSSIDLSAEYNQAGRLTAIALGESAGLVDLQGQILGSASGHYEAGGTWVPYAAGGVDIRAQHLGGDLSAQFAALNQRLNDGGVVGMRHFQLKQGDLSIGNELQASDVNVSVDNGQLTVAGTIDASGERVGSIRLAGKQGLTLAGNAVLDAHGEILRLDSYGKIIDSPNRAIVELNSGNGQLLLANGARIDLRHGTDDARVQADSSLHDNRDRGTLELNAPRLGATSGDIDIDAGGSLTIQGARSIAVNAVQRYDDAEYGTDAAASGRPYQIIDQAYLDAKHDDSTDFMIAALGNSNLLNTKLAGLNNAAYRDAFHLRPGVEIVSKTPDGDLIVSGDLDLSDHRYESLNPHTQKTGVYGSGEVGALVIRAGGDLDIYGSINDGFAPPPDTPDDDGWVLTPGYIAYGGDVVVPGPGVTLAAGTEFAAGKTLNYDLPIGATQFAAGTQLPVDVVLDTPLTLQPDTVLHAAIHDAAGNPLYAAGTIVKEAVTLTAGTRLGAGTVLPGSARLQAMLWPKGAALPSTLALASNLALPRGALIPSETLVKLPEDAMSMPLRPADGSRQGANWAVAAMLPEGSQSWSMRIVAGADTQAADTRLTRVDAKGNLVLADTHYSIFDQYETKVIPGSPAKPGGKLYWNELGALLGFTPGTPVDEADEYWCDEGLCVRVQYAWNEMGVELLPLLGGPAVAAGDPADTLIASNEELAYFCISEGLCNSLGDPIPAVPEQIIKGDLMAVWPVGQNFSVLRTGTGDLDLISGGNLNMQSLYGVYTAGTSSATRAGEQAGGFNQPRAKASDDSYLGTKGGSEESINAGYEALVDGGVNSTYAAWYPDGGGNFLLRAGGDLTGDMLADHRPTPANRHMRGQSTSANLGNWLWRQGTGETEGVESISTSWWINFGSYIQGDPKVNLNAAYSSITGLDYVPEQVGFTGFGTLGGGNLSVEVAGDAGLLTKRGGANNTAPRSQGLVLAVGSTGRVTADGELLLTGGGDMNVRIGGDLNPGLAARAEIANLDLNGVLLNLRGNLQVQSGNQGGIALNYGSISNDNDAKETRAFDPFSSTKGAASGGPVLMLGDAVANLSARGDLVLSGTGDPGRVSTPVTSAFTLTSGAEYDAGGDSWFSLWTGKTAINLLSAGGNLTPSTQLGDVNNSVSGNPPNAGDNSSTTDGRFVYPSQLNAVAANGSLYLGTSALFGDRSYNTAYSLLLAPSNNGRLSMLAGDSIYGGGYAVNQSGASLAAMPTPFNPAFTGRDLRDFLHKVVASNLSSDSIQSTEEMFPLFAFGPNTSVGAEWGSATPARFYAGEDIVGLRSGEILQFTQGGRIGQTWYESAGPVWMMAGRDIVNSGTQISPDTGLPVSTAIPPVFGAGNSTGNIFVHNDASDVSIVSAGRDILYSSFNVAGPGTLEITAGRNILMEDRASVTSLGPVVPGDSRPGASIVMQAGVGAQGANYAGFVAQYLTPANLADPEQALTNQEGKVAKTYEAELIEWLGGRYGFAGDAEQALAYYAALPLEQQRIFAREVYFAELREGGREYNDADGPRFGSYLRGRNAIAALFPTQDAAGDAIAYGGDILMYGGAGVRTNFGGGIQMLTPGGQQVFGVEGEAPPSTAGVITQGSGDIQLYSLGSILLGQSRIMTTFGGGILGWSAQGDINAGRGSKSTVVYTPPKRVYDNWGNVTLSSDVPSTGAGIATLAPIAEVPAGDIDLIAPLGTIDAGEAGIRVSGNVNLAALQVVNAANIQVQGEATGIPTIAAVNVGALTNASAAASSAATAAQDVMQRERASARQNLPSIFTVRVLGFGDEALPSRDGEESTQLPRSGLQSGARHRYDPSHPVRLVGLGGSFDPKLLGHLTDAERQRLKQDR